MQALEYHFKSDPKGILVEILTNVNATLKRVVAHEVCPNFDEAVIFILTTKRKLT
jgi:hypothetical protein